METSFCQDLCACLDILNTLLLTPRSAGRRGAVFDTTETAPD